MFGRVFKKKSSTISTREVLERLNAPPDFDEQSGTWAFMKQHLEKRLADCRNDNDSPSYDIEQTQILRGRIQEIKDLLDLPGEIRAGRYATSQSDSQ